MLASLVFETVLSLPPDKRIKPISVLCTDTRVEIPAIVEMVEGTLDKMRKCSEQHGLGVDANLLKPPSEHMNGDTRFHGPLTMTARRELLSQLLKLQEDTGLKVISEDELFLIQQFWKAARQPDDGGGVGRIVTRQKGIVMSDWKETNRLRELQEVVATEKGIHADTLRRLLAKVEKYSESHRAVGLPGDLLNILKDDLEYEAALSSERG